VRHRIKSRAEGTSLPAQDANEVPATAGRPLRGRKTCHVARGNEKDCSPHVSEFPQRIENCLPDSFVSLPDTPRPTSAGLPTHPPRGDRITPGSTRSAMLFTGQRSSLSRREHHPTGTKTNLGGCLASTHTVRHSERSPDAPRRRIHAALKQGVGGDHQRIAEAPVKPSRLRNNAVNRAIPAPSRSTRTPIGGAGSGDPRWRRPSTAREKTTRPAKRIQETAVRASRG